MGVKYVKDFKFPSSGGFHGSNKMPAKARASERGMPKMVKKAEGGMIPEMPNDPKPKLPALLTPRTTEFRDSNRNGIDDRDELLEAQRMSRRMRPGRGELMREVKDLDSIMARRRASDSPRRPMAPYMPSLPAGSPTRVRNPRAPIGPEGMKKGGKVTSKKAQAKVGKVMREFKEGKLHSGKDGPKVKNPKQAMAIALSEARSMKKAEGGAVSKGPKTRSGPAKNRRKAKERIERLALEKMEHAEKYAPGMDLDNIHDAELRQKSEKVERYAKGGKVHSDVKMDKSMMKKAVHKHEKAMHPGKPLTKLKRGGLPVHQGSPMYGKK
jgi:hypothetical protein